MTSERVFMRHTCKESERSEEIQTVHGQQGYTLYKLWLERQRKKAPPVETFLTSAYFTAFLKFAKYTREIGIADPARYLEVMTDKKIAPALWTRPECYSMYLESMDKFSTPYQQATMTVETLMALAEGFNVETKDVFKELQFSDVLDLIQQRKFSPWLLLCSKSFREWYTKLEDVQRTHLMKSIGINFWTQKFEEHPTIVKDLKEIATALEI
jgi:hypothetical protein